MIIKNHTDLEKYIVERIPQNVPMYVIDKVVEAIDYDRERPSFTDNWRSYLDSLPQNLLYLLKY